MVMLKRAAAVGQVFAAGDGRTPTLWACRRDKFLPAVRTVELHWAGRPHWQQQLLQHLEVLGSHFVLAWTRMHRPQLLVAPVARQENSTARS